METKTVTQPKRLLSEQWIVKLEKTLEFSYKIIKGNSGLAQIERKLTINQSFSQPIINTVFKDKNSSTEFSVISVLVDRFMNSFGFSTKMTREQLYIITFDTFDNFIHRV